MFANVKEVEVYELYAHVSNLAVFSSGQAVKQSNGDFCRCR